jgi:hypothetical protein
MSQMKTEEIVAVRVDGDLVCRDCLADDEQDFELDDVLTSNQKDHRDDTLFFCDRCGSRL